MEYESTTEYSHKNFDEYIKPTENYSNNMNLLSKFQIKSLSKQSSVANEILPINPNISKRKPLTADLENAKIGRFIDCPWNFKSFISESKSFSTKRSQNSAVGNKCCGLMRRLKNIKNSEKLSDILVNVGNSKFNCHLLVLQAFSPLFGSLMTTELMVDLPITKMTPQAFHRIYQWMLNDLPLERNTIVEVFVGALFLQMTSLINYCWNIFDNSQLFCEDSAFLLFLDTKPYHETKEVRDLQKLLLTRVNKFFLVLMTSKDFVELSLNDLCLLLTSNLIGVHSEMEVFFAAVRWLDYDLQNRQKHIIDVMKCVRFGLLPVWFLMIIENYTKCRKLKNILSPPEMKQILENGLFYGHIILRYGKTSYTVDNFQINFYDERHWVVDRLSSGYYEKFLLKMKENVSYKHFEEYATFIQKQSVGFWQKLKFLDEDNVLKLRDTRP